jgi:hypothetical protein
MPSLHFTAIDEFDLEEQQVIELVFALFSKTSATSLMQQPWLLG